jgi:hypothetical protein
MSDDRISAITEALVARGWSRGAFVVSEDGPALGAWKTYMAFTTRPSGTLVDVWAGPAAARDASDLVIAGEPLGKEQLRRLLAAGGATRAVAQIVLKTAGHGQGIGDAESGSHKGLPVFLEGVVHPPRIGAGEGGARQFEFFARTHAGGYARFHVEVEGDGPAELVMEPLGPTSGAVPTAAGSAGPGPAPRGPGTPKPPR